MKLSLLLWFLSTSAHAQTVGDVLQKYDPGLGDYWREKLGGAASPITTTGQAKSTLINLITWMMGIFWILTVAFLIWAAFLFLTAGGEEEKITKAKRTILYAVIAGVVATVATAIDIIVYNLLKGQ